jgi:uncharacterized membrane protein YqjE
MTDARAAGPLGWMSAAAAAVLEILSTRGELLAIEIAQEQAQLARLALYAALAVIAFGLGLQMAAMIAVAWFWDTPHRIAAVIGAAALFAAAGAICTTVFAMKLRAKRAPFGTSVSALQADIEALRPRR